MIEIGKLCIGDRFIFEDVEYKILYSTGHYSVMCESDNGKRTFGMKTLVEWVRYQ